MEFADDRHYVKTMRVAISIPKTKEVDGEEEEIPSSELEKTAAALEKEMGAEELSFAELLKATAQGLAEEQLFKFSPLVEVFADE